MTPHIKDILLLGGISTLITLILTFFPDNIVTAIFNSVWSIIFICSLIKLVWTKNLQTLNQFKEHFPRFSAFLTYIGWLPYVVTVFSAILNGIDMLTQNNNIRDFLANTEIILEYIYVLGFIISLITAVYKVFFKRVGSPKQ